VSARYQHVDPSAWEEVYVVGDVHGCADALDRLLERFDDGDSLFVFVGDLVRKGPDSKGVVDRVRKHDHCMTVAGNNERKLVDGRKALSSLTEADERWLGTLPLVISLGDDLVVHGGLDHRKPLTEHTPDELLNFRSLLPDGSDDRPYWFEERTAGPRVFFGHTVLAHPFATTWAVGLDTGCVYGGELTAFRLSTEKFVSVAPTQKYHSRSADSIVEPAPVRDGERA